MAPPSGRKGQPEAPPPPPVDPLCKHAADVPPNAVGAFTLDGKRITTPSGAPFHFQQSSSSQASFPTSTASRNSRFLVDGSVTGSFSSIKSPSPLLHKKASPELAYFVNEKTCFEEAPRFIAQAHSLNATSTFDQVTIAQEGVKGALNFTNEPSKMSKTILPSVETLVPAMMRKTTFEQASSCQEFPRFTAVLPNPKKRSAFERAATFIAALQSLQRISDSCSESNLPTASKFSLENKMKENIRGVSSTFRHGVLPSFMMSSLSSTSSNTTPRHSSYVSTFVDAPRSVIFHSKGFFWKTAPASSLVLQEETTSERDMATKTAQVLYKQLSKTISRFDFENSRLNDVDLSELTRSTSIEECESLVNLVGGVCSANMQCIREAFTKCQISLSCVSSTSPDNSDSISKPNNSGLFSFAPFGISVNETDGTVTMTVSCSFINDTTAAALVQWVARVADDIVVATNDNNNTNSTQQQHQQQQQQQASIISSVVAPNKSSTATDLASLAENEEDETDGEIIEPKLVEVVRIKASALPSNQNASGGGKDDNSTGGSHPNTPSRQGGRRGSTPLATTRAGGLAATSKTNAGAESARQQQQPTNENGNLERVTIPVPSPTVPEPELLTIWVPRTVKVPAVTLVDNNIASHEFEIPNLRDVRSLYFAAALALWDETSPVPPDVLLESRSRHGGCEPLLYLLRSLDIDRFLQAARSAGQPSLGPLPHDLAVLARKAKASLDQISKNSAPHLSVLSAMSALKMIAVPEQDEGSPIARFGNGTIVINETEEAVVTNNGDRTATDASSFYLRAGKFVYHSTSGPLPSLFASEDQRKACFSLQVTRVPPASSKKGSSSHHQQQRSSEQQQGVKCVFVCPYSSFEGSQQVCRAISGFAAVIDKYQL